jgi:hypothetical protein
MRTIRSNCFETNSSSTHSVTIISKTETRAENKNKPLEKDGVLYPANLRFASCYRVDNRDGYSLHAETVAEKTALFIHHIRSLEYYGEYEKADILPAVEYVIDRMTNVYGAFKEIDIKDLKDSNFEASDEDGTYLDSIFEKKGEDRLTAIDFFIRNTIMDDDKVIIDCDEKY